jgi:hypothetical protein
MRPDPGQALLDERIAASTVEERVAWVAAKRALGYQLVWQQIDAAGITDPVAQAAFMLQRLYPDMPEVWVHNVIGHLRQRQVAGQWRGPERPASP